MADDAVSRLEAMLKDVMPLLEEMADCCETVSRSARAINTLGSAHASPVALIPHLQTCNAGIVALATLMPRMQAFIEKWGQ